MGDLGVYNTTTVSYENPGGGLSMSAGGQRRPWNLSEMVSTPPTRSTWFHWTLLMGGSIVLGLGLIVTIIGIYNQHYYDPKSQYVKNEDEAPPSHWLVTLLGLTLAVLGLILLVIYCKMVNTNRALCNPLSRTLRQVVTKPRYQNGQTSQGANLLASDRGNGNPMSTQYDPVRDIGYRGHPNGDISSEEKAKLMAHEVKEGIDDIPSSSCDALLINGSDSCGTTPSTNSSSKDPRIVLHPFAKASAKNSSGPAQNPRRVFARRSPSPSPPQRPVRQFSSLRRNNPATSQQFHYKPRHFTGHGYGQGRLPSSAFVTPGAPLASAEDITPSLRSSFASVMMYAPSDWGNSDQSINSSVFLNLPPLSNRERDNDDGVEDDDDDDDNEFRVSPGRSATRKHSLSALSIQSAFS